MYGRMTRLQSSPDAVEKGIAFFKENVVPKARTTAGNAGAILLVDRKTGTAIGITLWETTQALNASEQLGSVAEHRAQLQQGARSSTLTDTSRCWWTALSRRKRVRSSGSTRWPVRRTGSTASSSSCRSRRCP